MDVELEVEVEGEVATWRGVWERGQGVEEAQDKKKKETSRNLLLRHLIVERQFT